MILEQIFIAHMAVFCYLIGDEASGEAALIDPGEDAEKILKAVQAHRLKVRWVINTHGHYDHTGADQAVLEATGATLVLHAEDLGLLDPALLRGPQGTKRREKVRLVEDGDELPIGGLALKVIHTPGHTRGGICLLLPGQLFTGDTLFTEGVGRTDLPGGSERELFASIKQKILSLPEETQIWPGHDYGRQKSSTVREQKRFF
jgi:glyoxylase-like metal-dependent hydrolase (beta-lactamase superfamily II)